MPAEWLPAACSSSIAPDHQTTRRVHSTCTLTFTAAFYCTSPIQPSPRRPHHPPPTTSHRLAPHATPPCRNLLQSPGILCRSRRLSQQLGTRAPSASTGKRGRRPPRCRPAIQFGRLVPPRSTSPSQTRQSSRHGRQLREVRQGFESPKGQGLCHMGDQCQRKGGEHLCVPSGRPLRCRQQLYPTRITLLLSTSRLLPRSEDTPWLGLDYLPST